MKLIITILILFFTVKLVAQNSGYDTGWVIKKTIKGNYNFDTIRLANNTAKHYRYTLVGNCPSCTRLQLGHLNAIRDVWVSCNKGVYEVDSFSPSSPNITIGVTFAVNKVGNLLILQLKMPTSSDIFYNFEVRKEE